MDKHTLEQRNPLALPYVSEWKWARAVRDGQLGEQKKRAEFLVQGKQEPKDDFDTRCKMVEYAPACPRAASRVLETALGGDVRREFPGNTKLEEVSDHATREGYTSAELAKLAIESALWGRYAVALLDHRKLDPNAVRPETAAEEREAGIATPYFCLYEPEDVMTWSVNDDGALSFVRLRTQLGVNEQGVEVTEYRDVSMAGIQLWRVECSGGIDKVLDMGITLHPNFTAAGVLPVAVAQIERIDVMRGRSPLVESLRSELQAFRIESDILFDQYVAAHPLLVIKSRRKLGEIGIGVNKYLQILPGESNVEGESIEWKEITGSTISELRTKKNEAIATILETMGVEVSAQDGPNGVASSGVQVAYEFKVKDGPNLKLVANAAERFERDLFALVAIDMGTTNLVDAYAAFTVAYDKQSFGLVDASTLMAAAQQARGLYGPDSPITIELMKRVARSILPNLDEDDYRELEKSIAGAYVAPQPDFGFGG